MNIIFDLDGTLIDSKKRLYLLFQELVQKSNLSFEEYWSLKSNKISHQEILTSKYDYSIEMLDEFNEKWMRNIETKHWLNFDEPFEGVSSLLIKLKNENHNLFLVTARQSIEMVNFQLSNFGWDQIFNKILVTQQKIDKFDLIINEINTTKDDFIIGDTGKDIETGQKLAINTVAVLSGFLNYENLAKYGPNKIINNVIDLKII